MNERTCTVVGCTNPMQARRLCLMHYKRLRKTGSTTLPNVEDLFFRHVTETPSGCWEWDKPHADTGYGQFNEAKKNTLAHRWIYSRMIGDIPDGLDLDHLCRNRACVNPYHLDPVPRQINLMRSTTTLAGINSRKSECVRGHEFTTANTYLTPDGRRQCRTCSRMRTSARRLTPV